MGQSGVISAIATPGSKLRSSKQVIEMDVEADGSKMTISNGYTKIETYNNDISFGAQHAQGVSHVKCAKRGHVTFGYSDIITTQMESRDTGQRVTSITYEISRELETRPEMRRSSLTRT